MRKYYLYALFDPNLKIPKYIGITNNPDRRYLEHLEDTNNTKKTRWIQSLKQGNKVPIMKVVKDTNDVHKVIEWEKLYIAKLQDKYGLVNSTPGGEYYGIGVPIKVYDLEGNYLDSYNSMIEYAELSNLPEHANSAISAVCLRKRNYAYGHIYRFLNDDVTESDLERLKNTFHSRDPKHFYMVSLNGEILGEFNSLQEAERAGFGNQALISQVLREVKGTDTVNGNFACYDIDDYDNKLQKYLSGKGIKDVISKYTLDGEYIDTFYTFSDAIRSLNTSSAKNVGLIKKCCELEYKQAHGFQWRYGKSTENIGKVTRAKTPQNTPVEQYDKNTQELIKTWNSAREAADSLCLDRAAINRAAKGSQKTAGGYIWKYVIAV